VSKADEFDELRPLLFSIAYRILGSVTEAQDAVQESWLRYASSATVPASAKAFLSATVTRISIDVLRSARARREKYVGYWFPEPLVTDPYEDPERSAELADSVSMAALLLLERLSPVERAVFVLREVFGFGFPEVASAVGRSEAACRQLAVRARRHMDAGRPRFEADRRERDELASRFFDALRDGDLGGLRELLAADVQLVGDGGGKAPQWSRAITGAQNVARLLASVFPPLVGIGLTVERHELNGQPGAIFRDRDRNVLSTCALDILDGKIQTIRTVQNPDKLAHVGPVGRLLGGHPRAVPGSPPRPAVTRGPHSGSTALAAALPHLRGGNDVVVALIPPERHRCGIGAVRGVIAAAGFMGDLRDLDIPCGQVGGRSR
jgi:RNA polymerase sigma-70 factor (ECF subfamily)